MRVPRPPAPWKKLVIMRCMISSSSVVIPPVQNILGRTFAALIAMSVTCRSRILGQGTIRMPLQPDKEKREYGVYGSMECQAGEYGRRVEAAWLEIRSAFPHSGPGRSICTDGNVSHEKRSSGLNWSQGTLFMERTIRLRLPGWLLSLSLRMQVTRPRV